MCWWWFAFPGIPCAQISGWHWGPAGRHYSRTPASPDLFGTYQIAPFLQALLSTGTSYLPKPFWLEVAVGLRLVQALVHWPQPLGPFAPLQSLAQAFWSDLLMFHRAPSHFHVSFGCWPLLWWHGCPKTCAKPFLNFGALSKKCCPEKLTDRRH